MQRGRTGQGYIYYRDRSSGEDVTVYEHVLMALLDHGPEVVFSGQTDVHHLAPGPDVNVPWFLAIVNRKDHRSAGGDRWSRRELNAFGVLDCISYRVHL